MADWEQFHHHDWGGFRFLIPMLPWRHDICRRNCSSEVYLVGSCRLINTRVLVPRSTKQWSSELDASPKSIIHIYSHDILDLTSILSEIDWRRAAQSHRSASRWRLWCSTCALVLLCMHLRMLSARQGYTLCIRFRTCKNEVMNSFALLQPQCSSIFSDLTQKLNLILQGGSASSHPNIRRLYARHICQITAELHEESQRYSHSSAML